MREHILSPIKTKIGEIAVTGADIEKSLRKTMYQDKLDAAQAINAVLGDGAYLGARKYKDGKPVDNHFFADRVNIGENEKIVFIRAREKANARKRFYVHEIFTEEDLQSRKDRASVSGTPPDGKYKGPFDYYLSIIEDHLERKEGEKPDYTNDPSLEEKTAEGEAEDEGASVDKDRVVYQMH